MDKNTRRDDIISKLLTGFITTLFWCLATFSVLVAYQISVALLIEYEFLSKRPFSEYSMPFFYITLFMHVAMISHVSKKLEISKILSAFSRIRRNHFKYAIKYGLLGCLFGLLCVLSIFALYVYISIVEGMSFLANRMLYGNYGILGTIVLIIVFLLCFLAGVKEGIEYGTQSGQ